MSTSRFQMISLCRKEWRVVMDTPLGYVMAVAFLSVCGFFFESNLFLIGQADMRAWFSILSLLLMFFVPAMAMRMLADEKRSGTFELLATMPITTMTIVLGKYLALCLQILALLVLTLLYPLTLSWLGNLDVGQVLASYLAAILLASSYAAVCLYASAVTRYEVVAYVFGFIMLLLSFLFFKAMPTFSPFFIAMNGLFLTLTWFELERRRWR